jgi:hypothetical protein
MKERSNAVTIWVILLVLLLIFGTIYAFVLADRDSASESIASPIKLSRAPSWVYSDPPQNERIVCQWPVIDDKGNIFNVEYFGCVRAGDTYYSDTQPDSFPIDRRRPLAWSYKP